MARKNKKPIVKKNTVAPPVYTPPSETTKKEESYLSTNQLLILTLVTAVAYYIYSLLPSGLYQHDEASHYNNMRSFWYNFHIIFGNWAKPGYKFLTVLPSLLGPEAVKIVHILFGAFTCFFSYKILQEYKSKFAILVFPVLSLAPVWINVIFRNYAENTVGFFLVLAAFLHLRNRLILAALVVSYAATIRQEYLALAGLYFWVLVLGKKKLIPALVLSSFPLLYQLYGMIAKGDMIYLYHFYIGYAGDIGGGEIWPYQGFDQFLEMSIHTLGVLILGLFILYVPGRILMKKMPHWIVFAPFVTMFFIYCLFNATWFTIGPAASTVRLLNGIAPLGAILAVLALDDLIAVDTKKRAVYLAFVIPFLICVYLFLSFTHDWTNVTETRDWKPFILISALLAATLLIKKLNIARLFIFVFGFAYAIFLIKPIPVHAEEEEMQELVNWFNKKNDGRGRFYNDSNRIYCSHSLLYYYMGKPREAFTKESQKITIENIINSKKGDVIIWESHYGYRPKLRKTSLQNSYFSSRPQDYQLIRQQLGSKKKFSVNMYQKLTDSDTTLNGAIIAYSQAKYDSSITMFSNILSKNPRNATAYFYRGLCSSKLNKPQNTFNDYNTALQLNPNLQQIYGERGKLLAKYGNYPQAINDLNRYLKSSTRDLEGYFYRGTAYLNTGDLVNARNDFNKALTINARAGGVYYNLELIDIKSNNKQAACINFKKARQFGLKQADAMIKQHCSN